MLDRVANPRSIWPIADGSNFPISVILCGLNWAKLFSLFFIILGFTYLQSSLSAHVAAAVAAFFLTCLLPAFGVSFAPFHRRLVRYPKSVVAWPVRYRASILFDAFVFSLPIAFWYFYQSGWNEATDFRNPFGAIWVFATSNFLAKCRSVDVDEADLRLHFLFGRLTYHWSDYRGTWLTIFDLSRRMQYVRFAIGNHVIWTNTRFDCRSFDALVRAMSSAEKLTQSH